MNTNISRIISYRTLDITARKKYYKTYFKPYFSQKTSDYATILTNMELFNFIVKHFHFTNPLVIEAFIDAVFLPDFKVIIDNGTRDLHRVFDKSWRVFRVLDMYEKTNHSIHETYFQLFKDLTAHLSKFLMLGDIYHQMAKSYAALGTCNRLSVGALIVKRGRVISTGTNGSIEGMPSCKDEGCLMSNNHCLRTVHSEENCLLFCSQEGISVKGTVMYCTHMPCISCLKSIAQSGIIGVYFDKDYDDGYNKKLAAQLSNRIEFYMYDGSMYRLLNSKI